MNEKELNELIAKFENRLERLDEESDNMQNTAKKRVSCISRACELEDVVRQLKNRFIYKNGVKI